MSDDLSQVASSAAIEHLRWSLTAEVGPITFARLIERFGSAQTALGVTAAQLADVEGIGPATAEAIVRSRDHVDVRREVMRAAEQGLRILCREDDAYPPSLRHVPDAPICLYVRGRLEPADAVAVAVVGSRKCSIYGREQAYRFGYALAQRGITVVSGLARGADSESHKGALAAGGRTLAVLGNGLGTIYPPEHRELAERIVADGALLSELPVETSPEAKNFLPRNRIIAGLTLGTIVVEAGRRSGALSTAARASEYDREVFAVPGRVDAEESRGTNALIRDQHGKLVTCVDDVIDELGSVGEALKAPGEAQPGDQPDLFDALPKLTGQERAVLDQLNHEERSIEAIAELSGLPTAKVAATLLSLQLRGLVRQLPGNVFVRVRKA